MAKPEAFLVSHEAFMAKLESPMSDLDPFMGKHEAFMVRLERFMAKPEPFLVNHAAFMVSPERVMVSLEPFTGSVKWLIVRELLLRPPRRGRPVRGSAPGSEGVIHA